MASAEHDVLSPETAEAWRGDMTSHVFLYEGPDVILKRGTPIEVDAITLSLRGWEGSDESAAPGWSAARIWFGPMGQWFVRACRVTIAGVRVRASASIDPRGGPGMKD